MRIVVVLALLVPSSLSMAAAPTTGPLISISTQEYLKLPLDIQALYVAGVIDGVSYMSYGYSLPDHDAYVKCARTIKLGDLAQRVADWIRAHPKFSEGPATAVSKTMGASCGHPSAG